MSKGHASPAKYFVRKKEAVRIMKDGREICDVRTTAGHAEYMERVLAMRQRQDACCCLCGKFLKITETTFEHELGRGHGGGHRDDRTEINGRWINGAAHWNCNLEKASRRADYNKPDARALSSGDLL